MNRPFLALAILIATTLCVSPAAAETTTECKGDFNLDHMVTVDELIAAVHSALRGCGPSPEEQACLDSGGTVSTGLCCSTAPDFPDTCRIGSCGCSPSSSRQVQLCECGENACFDRKTLSCVTDGAP